MRRRFAQSLAFLALAAGCSLAIDTGDLSGTGGSAADASADGQPPTADATTPASDAADVDGASGADAGASDASDIDATVDAATPVDAGSCSADLTTDPKNCGRCGRDCLGGTCSEARCAPVAVVSGELGILGLALDATDLYWSKFDGSIRTSKLDGTQKGDLRKLAGAGHIEVDDTYLYAPGFGAGSVFRIRKDGNGPIETLAPCAGQCLGVALAGGRVYFTERVGSAGNLRVVEGDGGASVLLASLSFPEDIFAGPTQLFIANEGANDILGLPYGSTTSAQLLTVTDPVSLVVDATDMWIVSQNTKTIRRRALAGGAVITMVDLPSTPTGIAQTASAIYWTNEDGTILRLAK